MIRNLNTICYTICIVCIVVGVVVSLCMIWEVFTWDDYGFKSLMTASVLFLASMLVIGVNGYLTTSTKSHPVR